MNVLYGIIFRNLMKARSWIFTDVLIDMVYEKMRMQGRTYVKTSILLSVPNLIISFEGHLYSEIKNNISLLCKVKIIFYQLDKKQSEKINLSNKRI